MTRPASNSAIMTPPIGQRHPIGVSGRSKLRGITLIELMVGLVIGLIAVLVISQVLLAAEGQKRTTTSGSDAQLTGSLALYTLQRDLQMAGYGISASQLGLGCTIKSLLFSAANGGATRRMAPAVITPGASGAPDTLRILASSKGSFSVPSLITSDHPKTGAVGVTEFIVNNAVGIQAGDLMIAVPAAPDAANTCTMFVATGAGSTPDKSFTHATGAGVDPQGWNGSGTGAAQTLVSGLFPAAGYPAGSYVVNLGAGLVDRTYSVVNGTLQMSEFDSATASLTTTDLFPQVVNMRFLYGKDTSVVPDGSVDIYDNVLPTTPAAWAQVITLRIALAVRSNQFEQDEVTPAHPFWDLGSTIPVSGAGSANCASGTGKCIELKVNGEISNSSTDWKHYRYRIYDTVIPVRNLVWRS